MAAEGLREDESVEVYKQMENGAPENPWALGWFLGKFARSAYFADRIEQKSHEYWDPVKIKCSTFGLSAIDAIKGENCKVIELVDPD